MEEQKKKRAGRRRIEEKYNQEIAATAGDKLINLPYLPKTDLKGKPLTFAVEYLRDRNAARAARAAGYGEAEAKTISQYLLKHPAVSQFIRQYELRLMQEADVQIKDVVNILLQIATSNIEDYVNPDGSLKNLLDCPNTAAISEYQQIEDILPTGKKIVKTRIKLHNKINALDSLSKYLGLYERDNRQRPAQTVINLDRLDVQQLQALITATPDQIAKALRSPDQTESEEQET